MFTYFLEKISVSEDLTPGEAENALQLIVNGDVSDEEVAAFLYGMRMKGEKVGELTAFVNVMREASVAVNVDVDGAVDLCGTGVINRGHLTSQLLLCLWLQVPVFRC